MKLMIDYLFTWFRSLNFDASFSSNFQIASSQCTWWPTN